MADTIRSLSELNTMLGDNLNGAITPQHIRDLMVSQMCYGEIGSGSKAGFNIGTGFQVVDCTVAGVVGRGLTADTTNKRISGTPVDMKAEVLVEVAFTGTNGRSYEFAVFRNGTEQLTRITDSVAFLTGITARIAIGASIQLQANDFLDLRVRASAAASNFTLARARLFVKRIGVE